MSRVPDRFCEETSVIGFRYLHSSHQCWFRLICSAVVVVFIGLTTYQISDRIRWYQKNPLTLTIDRSTQLEMDFPAVTVCNPIGMKPSRMMEYNGSTYYSGEWNDLIYLFGMEMRNGTRGNSLITELFTYLPQIRAALELNVAGEDWRATLREGDGEALKFVRNRLPRIYKVLAGESYPQPRVHFNSFPAMFDEDFGPGFWHAAIALETVNSWHGIDYRRMYLDSVQQQRELLLFAGSNMGEVSVTPMMTTIGKCFTIKLVNHTVMTAGLENALHLRLNVERYDQFANNEIGATTSLRVFVHPPTKPPPSAVTGGQYVYVGRSVEMSIDRVFKTVYHDSQCGIDVGAQNTTQDLCRWQRVSEMVERECGCVSLKSFLQRDMMLSSGDPRVITCSMHAEHACVPDAWSKAMNETIGAETCPDDCVTEMYDVATVTRNIDEELDDLIDHELDNVAQSQALLPIARRTRDKVQLAQDFRQWYFVASEFFLGLPASDVSDSTYLQVHLPEYNVLDKMCRGFNVTNIVYPDRFDRQTIRRLETIEQEIKATYFEAGEIMLNSFIRFFPMVWIVTSLHPRYEISDINLFKKFGDVQRHRLIADHIRLNDLMRLLRGQILSYLTLAEPADYNAHVHFKFYQATEWDLNEMQTLFNDQPQALCYIERAVTVDSLRAMNFMKDDFITRWLKVLDHAANFFQQGERYTGSNIIELRLYYSQLYLETTTYDSSFTIWSLLSDIGGTMGLYLGATIATFFETLIIICQLERITLKKAKRDGSGSGERHFNNSVATTPADFYDDSTGSIAPPPHHTAQSVTSLTN